MYSVDRMSTVVSKRRGFSSLRTTNTVGKIPIGTKHVRNKLLLCVLNLNKLFSNELLLGNFFYKVYEKFKIVFLNRKLWRGYNTNKQ